MSAVLIDDLVAKLPRTVVRAAGGDPELADLVSVLVGLPTSEAELLALVSRDVRDLKEAPFHTGASFVEEAARPRRTVQQRLDSMEKAKDEFLKARATLRREPLWSALCELRLCFCYWALGDPDAARLWLRRAHLSMLAGLARIVLLANHGPVVTSSKGVGAAVEFAAVFVPFAGISATKRLRKSKVLRGERDARQLITLAATLADVGDQLGLGDSPLRREFTTRVDLPDNLFMQMAEGDTSPASLYVSPLLLSSAIGVASDLKFHTTLPEAEVEQRWGELKPDVWA